MSCCCKWQKMPVKFGLEERAQIDTFLSIPFSQNSSCQPSGSLLYHYVPTTRASCSKVTCYATSELWGRSALLGSSKSCQHELAYSLGNTPSGKGFFSQCLASYIQMLVVGRKKIEHFPPHHISLLGTCLYFYHLSLEFWLLFSMCLHSGFADN
jgi:hypothetical protein